MTAGRDRRVGPVVLWSSDISELKWGWLSQLSVFDGREAVENWAQLVSRPFYDGLAELHPPAEVRTAAALSSWSTVPRTVAWLPRSRRQR